MGGPEYFNDLLAQGMLHEDLAPYVDTLLAANVLGGLFHFVGRYIIHAWKAKQPPSPMIA